MTLYMCATTLVLATSAAGAVVVAIWAGQSQWYWFWRAFAVWLCVAAMLPIRAYEPAMVFGISLPIIALAVWAGEAFQTRRQSAVDAGPGFIDYRFGLRDALLAIALLSMVLSVVVEVPRGMARQPNWPRAKTAAEILVPAAGVAVVGLLAWLAAQHRHRLITVSCLAIAVGGFAWAMWPQCQWLYVLDDDLNEIGLFSLLTTLQRERLGFLVTLSGLSAFAAIVFAVAFLSRAAAWSVTAGRAYQSLLVVVGIGLAIVYWRTTQPTPFPPSLTVLPNHFDRVMQIAKRVKEINEGSVAAEDVEEDDPLVASELRDLYVELLPLLAAPNAKSVDLSSEKERQARERSDTEVYGFARTLSRWLVAEAKAAGARGDLPAATDFAIATIQFGAAFRRNGLLIDDVVGGAATSNGYRELYTARRDLDAQTARRAVGALREIDAGLEPTKTMIQRDVAYCERVYGWQGSFSNPIARLTQGEPSRWKSYAWCEKAAHNWRTILRLLEIELAVRAFKVERGQLPATLTELVPEYLPVEPLDPFSGQSFILRPAENSDFTLYGVGSDGEDNGGQFTDLSAHQQDRAKGYDFDLDTLVRKANE